MLESEIPDFIKGRLRQKGFDDPEKERLRNLPIKNFEDKYSSVRQSFSTNTLFNHYKSTNQITGKDVQFPRLPVSAGMTRDSFYNAKSGTKSSQRLRHVCTSDPDGDLSSDDMFNFTTAGNIFCPKKLSQ